MRLRYIWVIIGFVCLSEEIDEGSPFDNFIIGNPVISCERDRITVDINTEKEFNGKIFVKGEYANPQCVRVFRNGMNLPFGSTAPEYLKPFEGTVTKHEEDENHPSNVVSSSPIRSRPAMSQINSAEEPENPLWKTVGGASSSTGAAFGGSRGEEWLNLSPNELKIFEKPQASNGTRLTQCEPKACEPCVCSSNRARRAVNSVRLDVPLEACNSKRDRKLNPPSLIVSFVAVVSFHDSFITKLDKAYHIQCSYAEYEKSVSTDLNVNMNEETELQSTIEAPACDYFITDKLGRPVQNGFVGTLVNHRWSCHGGQKNKLRMLVHDCYIEDGSSQQFQVIDEHGCSRDELMLQTPNYSEDGFTADVDSYIFKFPDRSSVDFRCSIQFCSIDDGECSELTPPRCEKNARRRRNALNSTQQIVLHANSMTILDVDMESSERHLPPQAIHSNDSMDSFCLSVTSFGILISASTFFTTISMTVVFLFVYVRFNEKFV